ncbi:MAG: ferritin-like domain-containing protein [Vicinamibacterales bacterium]
MYSETLTGAEYMAITSELEVHAKEELQHALTIAKQIDYLGGMPTATALPVKLTEDAKEMLRAAEYAIAEDIRELLRQEQEHQIDLANALGEHVPRRVPGHGVGLHPI